MSATMKTVAVLLVAALSALGPGCGAQSIESVVQAAVIDSLFVNETTRQVVVGDSTVRGGSHFVDSDYRNALRGIGTLPEGLQQDFEAKRDSIRQVDSLPTKVPMRRVTAADRASLRSIGDPKAFWLAFFQRYPASSGLIQVSRVGFSRDGASALVHIEYGCGGLCGGTKYVLLTRESGRWHVTRVVQPRIS
jgi:hypothetical protein